MLDDGRRVFWRSVLGRQIFYKGFFSFVIKIDGVEMCFMCVALSNWKNALL